MLSRKQPFRTTRLVLISSLSLLVIGCAVPSSGADLPEWTLTDYFHYNWHNELVTYPVDDKTAATKNLSLVSGDGAARPYQWIKDGTKTKIAFMADIPLDGTATYRLTTGTPTGKTDLQLEETTDEIRLFNQQTGVAIRKSLNDGEGPIASIRLASGQWIADSDRDIKTEMQSYTARVVERGPVLDEILCEAKFAGGKNWRMRLRLLAGEPVVVITESSSLPAGTWRLRLDKNFSPTHVFRRNPLRKTILSEPIPAQNGVLAVVEPWLKWWEANHGTWAGLYNGGSNDLLSLGALNPSIWVDLDKLHANIFQANATVPFTYEDGAVYANFDLTNATRRWMIASLDKNASLEMLGGKDAGAGKAPPPHQYVIKYGDFPLDRVKDYVLDWPDTADHPRLIVNKDDVARLRKSFKGDTNSPASFLSYLATGDEQMGRKLVPGALNMMQAEIDNFMKQEWKGSLGAWPHNQQGIDPAFNAVDMVWNVFTPEERKRVKAQAALIGYTVSSPDYWSLERGFHANPNMTTMVAGYQSIAGHLLADHPLHAQWAASGVSEAKRQLEEWSDENGGWLEAPHYANVSYDHMLGLFLTERGQDGGASLYNPKMKKVAEFFAHIATPPDVRVGGIRHEPRIGNTWLDEPSGLFGILAALWKDRDPKFASEMQWMYKQQGEWPENGIGGGFPSFGGIRQAFLDPTVPAVKPDYGSIFFPKTGVSLRNAVDDRETQLYLIAGTNHEHYDDDSGSITLWGKGRIVANDFAYSEAAAQFHSMITGGGREAMLSVQKFVTKANHDYVHGTSGQWQRQIIFVKDKDLLAPNYFVLRDSIGAPATWRLWLDGAIDTGQTENAGDGMALQSVKLTGKDDVDTDIALISKGALTVTAEEKTTKTFGLGPDKIAAANQPFGLTGLTASLAANQDLVTVVYPRLKTQKPPRITVLAGGKALKIEHEAGTDYVFLSQSPFTYDEGDIHFEGSGGIIKIRGEKVSAELGEGAKLAARGQAAG